MCEGIFGGDLGTTHRNFCKLVVQAERLESLI